MLGPAQPDAPRAVAPGLGRLLGLVGVRPDGHPSEAVGPAEDRLELGLVLEAGLDRRDRPHEDLPGRAVDADPIAFDEAQAAVRGAGALRAVVDDELGAAGDARLADLAGDDRGVRGRTATGGQDPLGHGHAVEVVGRGLDPDEDDLLAAPDPLDRDIGVEHGLADRGAGRCVQALRDALGAEPRAGIELGAQELIDLGRLDPADRLLLRDHPVGDHVDGDLDCRRGRPLGRAGLEHVQLAALDRELEVLDVAVVRFELLADLLELVVDRGHVLGHLRDLRRRPDAGHDVLALGVGEVLAEQDSLAGVGVAGEGDARPRIVAHVAEDHRHDVHGGAQVVGDPLALAVVPGALAEPAREDGLDREVELLVRVGRKVAPGVRPDDRLVFLDQGLQVRHVEVGVLRAVAVGLLAGLERLVEATGRDLEHDPAEHRDEPAIGVPAETLVAGQGDEALERVLVQAEVEDGIHHAGHRELGTRSDAHEQRVLRIAEALAGTLLDLAHRADDVVPEAIRELLAGREVVVAGLGRDREAGRSGQAGLGHLGEARAFSAEEVLHPGVALGRAVAPGVDVALRGGVRSVARGRGGRGHRAGSSESWNAARGRRGEGFAAGCDCTRGPS